MTDVQTAVSTSIVVDAPIERAFAVFTEDIGSWWPQEHHMLQGQESHMVLEPKEGGRIYEIGADGSDCKWSHVLVWEPPHRLVFTWELSPQWSLETDIAKASEVEVRFTAEDDGRTQGRRGTPQPRPSRRGLGRPARRHRFAAGLAARAGRLRPAGGSRRRSRMEDRS